MPPADDSWDRWTLVIPGYFPPSLNKTQMAHWSRVRKNKQRALEMLHIYTIAQEGAGNIPQFVGPVDVTIERLWGKRQRAWDIENLYGSVKPLVDAMRVQKAAGGRRDRGRGKQGGLGIIEDDDPRVLTLNVGQYRNSAGDELATRIKIVGRRAC